MQLNERKTEANYQGKKWQAVQCTPKQILPTWNSLNYVGKAEYS